MINDFVQAWGVNNKKLLKSFETKIPEDYSEVVKRLIEVVINPYLTQHESRGLDIDKITIVDDGDYQGTILYIIPFEAYEPTIDDYVVTYIYYGSCSFCDTFEGIIDYNNLWSNPTKEQIKNAAKEFNTLALHILQRFKHLGLDE